MGQAVWPRRLRNLIRGRKEVLRSTRTFLGIRVIAHKLKEQGESCNTGGHFPYKAQTGRSARSGQSALETTTIKTDGAIMRENLAQETNGSGSPKPDGVTAGKANLFKRVSWFIRICGVTALFAAMPRFLHEGWPHSLRTCGSLSGIFNGTMLFVMSFLFVTAGRTKVIIAGATIALCLWVIVFSVAILVLPHL